MKLSKFIARERRFTIGIQLGMLVTLLSKMMIEEVEELEVEAFVPDLERIHTAGKHLFTLISDILDISKIEVGKMDLDLEIFHVSQIVQDVGLNDWFNFSSKVCQR